MIGKTGRNRKNRWMWVCLLIFAVAVAMTVGLLLMMPSAAKISFSPTIASASTAENAVKVEPDTAFFIDGAEALTEAALRVAIKTEPKFAYGLVPVPEVSGRWLLTPGKTLEAGQSYSISTGMTAYKFTVANTLLLLNTYPLDGSTNISPNSGIEMLFNSTNILDPALEKAITVTPDLKFNLSNSGGRFAIYAEEGQLAADTEYTVTVDSSLTGDSGKLSMRESKTFKFKTRSEAQEQAENTFTLSGNYNSFNALTDEVPYLQVFFDKSQLADGTTPPLDVKLYKYSNAEAYKKDLLYGFTSGTPNVGKSDASFSLDTSCLTEYSAFTAQPVPLENDSAFTSGAQLVSFPEALPEGWYAAAITYTSNLKDSSGNPCNVTRYRLIQSSDLSVFFMQTGKDLLMWVNDAATGLPVNGATLEMEGDIAANGVTAADGTLLITDDPQLFVDGWYKSGIFTVKSGEHTFIDGQYLGSNFRNDGPALLYTSSLFTDRPVYRTTDTIHIWGFVRPRHAETPLPEKLTLELPGIDPITGIVPDKSGFFSCSMKLEQLGGSEYARLNLMADGEELNSVNLRIYDFIKPVYTVDMTPERPVYLVNGSGEAPAVSGTVTLFDGTPVPNFKGNLQSNQWNFPLAFQDDGEITTDSVGHFRSSFTTVDEVNTWYPRHIAYQLTNSGAEEENYLASGYLYAIFRDVMLETKTTFHGDTVDVTVDTHSIDISRIKTSEDLYKNNYELLRGAPFDATHVNAVLYSSSYEKERAGSTYDYINRVSVPSYHYKEVVTPVKTYDDFSITGGTYTFKDLPVRADDELTSYYLHIDVPDSRHMMVHEEIQLTPRPLYPSNDTYLYTLNKISGPVKTATDGNDYYGSFIRRFGDGEDVSFQLCNNDVPLETMKGNLLWSTVKTGFENVSFTGEKQITLPFSEELLPNYTITGAYFDGKHIFAMGDTNMTFDAKQRELDIAVDSGKDIFAPGEKVDLTATVTEKKTGKPAADAEVLLSVVDESIFAIEEQDTNILNDIYQNIFYPSINKYASFHGPEYGGGGEMGGGGGNTPIRENFPDTVLFQRYKTDGNGKVKASFTLPDNLTSWRITSLAVTDSNWAGNSKRSITSTMDYYVIPMVSEKLLAGDSLAIGLRSAGRMVTANDPVTYTVLVEGDGYSKTAEGTYGGIREYGWATFEGLPVGNYTVTVKGSCKEYSDTVKLPFEVIPSGIEVATVKTINLADGLAVEPLRYPVIINLYDKNYAIYNRVLSNLLSVSHGQRADMRIAAKITSTLMEQDGINWYTPSADINISDLQGTYEAIKLFPGSAPLMSMTAKAALASPKLFPVATLGYKYEANKYPSDEWEVADPASYYIMKALAGNFTPGEEIANDYNYVNKLDLAIAYALSGKTDSAKKTYSELVTPRLKKLTGVSGEQGLYLEAVDGLSVQECTAAASRLASVLGLPDADGFMLYLTQRESKNDTSIMEQLIYLRYSGAKAAADPAKLTCTIDGKTETKTLDRALTTLALSKAQLAALQPKVESGTVYADIYYTTLPDDRDESKKLLGITRTIEPVNGDTFVTGEPVKITLTPDLSGLAKDFGGGEIIVDDYLPTGIKFEKFDAVYEQNLAYTYLVTRQNQRLRFAIQTDSGKVVPIVYYGRCGAPGNYIIESTYIASGEGSAWGSSGQRGSLAVVVQ